MKNSNHKLSLTGETNHDLGMRLSTIIIVYD